MSGFAQGAIAGTIALLVTIQLIQPARVNPPIVQEHTLEAAVAVPSAIREILERSCNDCHSDHTQWPWYSYVAPISWFVAKDVNQGRRHLNFSQWLPPGVENPGQYTRQRFYAVCKSVESQTMPMPAYVLTHPRARLSQQDRETICLWTQADETPNLNN